MSLRSSPSPLAGEGRGEGYGMVRLTNAPEEKARKAAEVLASGDTQHQELLLQFTKLDSGVDKLAGMVGVNITWTLGRAAHGNSIDWRRCYSELVSGNRNVEVLTTVNIERRNAYQLPHAIEQAAAR
jgi:hypothetical protein